VRALAVAARVLAQLRRDPRTIVLIVAVPALLETLLKELFAGRSEIFQHVGAPLLGLFPFVTMFLVTSITMLRERTTGTLERLMASPLRKLDLLAGYGLAFGCVAAVQAGVVSALTFGALGLDVAGPKPVVAALAVAHAVLGTALGLFVARGDMATWLRWISDALPLTYAYDALAHTASDTFDARFGADVGVVCGCILLALALGAATLRRRTA